MRICGCGCADCGHVTGLLERAGRRGRHACESCGSARTATRLSTFAPQAGRTPSSRCLTCADGKCPMAGAT